MIFTEQELIILSQALRLREMVMVQTAATRKDFERIRDTSVLKGRFQKELQKVRRRAAQETENEHE